MSGTDRGRVLVTGGGRGVGAAIVRALAGGGYDVDFTFRTAEREAEALRAEIAAAHPESVVRAHPLDLADRGAVAAFTELLADAPWWGLVHNAGQPYDTLAATLDVDRAEAIMQVNLWSFAALAKAAMRPMIRARAGRIVAIGSVAASRANPGNAAYGATKAALAAYCRTLAIETAKRGVTVNCVAPGFVDTDMMAAYGSHRPALEAGIPAGRFASPSEVAAVVAFLLGPGATYVTGTTIPVDGGLSAALPAGR